MKSSLIPDERLRNLDPEGGYEDEAEVSFIFLTASSLNEFKIYSKQEIINTCLIRASEQK